MNKKSGLCLAAILAVFTVVGCSLVSPASSAASSSEAPASSSEAAASSSEAAASSSEAAASSSESSAPAGPVALPDPTKTSEDATYDYVFSNYPSLIETARAIKDDDQRFAAYAKAEAFLLDTNAFMPTSTDGGSYAITHAAYKSVPSVSWGFDSDRLETSVVSTSFVTPKDREKLKKAWDKAVAEGTTYNPKALLLDMDYTLVKEYNTTFSELPQTLDIQGTSRQADTEYIVQGLDTLLKYDLTNRLQPAIASSYEVSADGKKYTFTIRDDVNWMKADKTTYAKLTPQDFVTGFQHMLDAKAGLESLVYGVVKNAKEYVQGKKDITDVGMYVEDGKLVIELERDVPYFPTMLTYNLFTPLNKSFFVEKGGALGINEFKAAKAKDTYKYGLSGDPASILYNGAFICTQMTDKSKIVMEANPSYYNKDIQNVEKITYLYNDGSDPTTYYRDVVQGKYVGCGLSSTILPLAQEDGNFDKYAYVTGTTATTYFSGNNLYRKAYDCAKYPTYLPSTKTDAEKALTKVAMYSKNFRKAINYAFNKHAYQAASKGADLADASIRNMFTRPDFVYLSKDVTYDGKTFKAGTSYGAMVQAYFDDINKDGIDLADGVDGWYNPTLAKSYMDKAVEEIALSGITVTKENPVVIDIINYSTSSVMEEQAQIYKKYIEEATDGLVKVLVNDTPHLAVYYYSGYYASTGAEGNYDVFAGSGWGPDFGDPITYLDTFLPDGAGYMTKVCGLY